LNKVNDIWNKAIRANVKIEDVDVEDFRDAYTDRVRTLPSNGGTEPTHTRQPSTDWKDNARGTERPGSSSGLMSLLRVCC
jgi:hypothetical protein